MSRRPVEQVTCDRCKRKELQVPSPGPKQPALVATFGEKSIHYEDLCERCHKAIENTWHYLTEWERELRQATVTSFQEEGLAPPLEIAPQYSPPQPHSAAASGRR